MKFGQIVYNHNENQSTGSVVDPEQEYVKSFKRFKYLTSKVS